MQSTARFGRDRWIARLFLVSVVLTSFPAVSLAGAEEAHESLTCSRCHASGGGFATPSSSNCRSCHAVQTAASDRVLQAFHSGTQACTDCHRFHDPETVQAGGRRFHVKSREECAACHVTGKPLSGVSGGHVAASAFYHSDREESGLDSPSDVCLACHSKSGSPVEALVLASVGPVSAPRFHEEASHPYGIEVPLGSGTVRTGMRNALDSRIRLFEGKIECVTCHDLTETADDQLVRFEAKYDLCTGCHRNGVAGEPPSFAERLNDR